MLAFLVALVILVVIAGGFALFANQQAQITALTQEVESMPTATAEEIADMARAARISTRDIEDRLNRLDNRS